MKKNFDKKSIMRRAWELRRASGLTMGEAMKAAWSEAKAAAGASEYDADAQEYFSAKAEYDRAKQRLEAIAGRMQAACLESPDFTISGYGWKASWKEVTSQRFDTKAFRAEHDSMYKDFCKPQTTRRFLCNPVALA